MTNQNNAAQPGLTDDEIKAIRDSLGGGFLGPIPFARAIESALLSKLRAEGVQAGDDRAAFNERYEAICDRPITVRETAWRMWKAGRAALASAPVAGWGCAHKNKVANAAAYVWHCRDCGKFIPREPGDMAASAPVADIRDELNRLGMMAHTAMNQDASDMRNIMEDLAERLLAMAGGAAPESAPVAAEARPAGWQNALRIAELPEVDKALANFCDESTLDNAVGLVLAVLGAAPQASTVAVEAPSDMPTPIWWINHGLHGQITLRHDEADRARQAGATVYQYHAAPQASEAVRDALAGWNSEATREAAWQACRKHVGTGGWTAAEAFNYRGFFLHGWRAALSAQPGAQKSGGGDAK